MRPTLLNPLFAPVTTLPGVGPKQDKLLRYLLSRDETPRLVDLLLHLPASVIDRRAQPKIREAVQGTMVTLEVTVDRHRPPPPRNSRAPYLVYASDDTGDVVLTFFRAKPGYVEKLLPVGEKRYVSGTLQMYDGIPQIVHPDRVVDEAGFAKLSGIDPVYPLTEGLALGSLRRAIAQALQKLPDLPEWISPEVIRRCSFPPIREALNRVHVPVELTDILPDGPFWSRLAFDELARRPTGAGAGARAVAASGRRPQRRRRPSAPQDHRRPALRADVLAARGGRRHRRGSAPAGADAAAAAGRCRLRQDGGGAARRGCGRRGRQAGRADGADRNPRAPAHQDHHAAGRTRRPARGDPDRPRKGQGAARDPGAAGSRRDRFPGRHPCADPGRRDLQGAGAGGGRRTASFWRARAAGADQQGRSRRCAGAERDADPAHAGADLFRRHGRLRIAREAGRPPADRNPHDPDEPPRRGDRRRRPRAEGGQAGLLDLPAGGGIRGRGHRAPHQRHRARSSACNSASATASVWCTAR